MALKGVLSAIITPFTSNGDQIDEANLRTLVNQSIEDGVDGLVAGGGTGEFATLSHVERRRIVEIIVEEANGRVEVLAHTGATSSREAVILSKHAQEVGASSVMLATPYYEPIGLKEAFAYYAAVAEQITLPICAYNFPPATGLMLDVEFLLKLAREIPQISYVKDSSSNISQMNTLLSEHAGEISFLNGEDVLMLPALVLQSPGMVMGIANFMTPALSKLYKASLRSDWVEVVQIWQEINPVIRILGSGPYNSGVKAACELLGLRAGPVRGPVAPYDAEQTACLKSALDKLDPSLLTRARC